MTSRPLNAILQQLRAVGERDGAGSTDGELLTRFLSQRDDAALAALVERHAPMVWGVCRRVLRNPHDAEDAFQATFLVLVRKAGTVMSRELVANWLYGVAHQTAVRLKATAAKRGVREMQLKEMPEPAVAEARVSGLLPILDQELSRLSEQHRVLIVLCDLEGKTRKEAARQLGCPEGTVASRLARARDMLAKRMARHGMAVSGGSLAAVFSQSSASAGVPDSVVSSTIHVATLLAANQAAGVISGPVAALSEGVLKAMLLKKIMTTTMVVLALSVAVITGGSLAIGQTEGTGKPVEKPPITAEKPIDKPPATAVAAKDAIVNTPTILGKLQGEWELQPKTEGEYKQRMIFTASNSGNWQRSKETLPVSITYYVEGRELLIQFYHEPNGAFNYRLKQLRFEYKLDKDILTLTAGEATKTWKRIPKANPKPEGVKMPPEKEAIAVPSNAKAEPAKPKPNYVTVVGQLLDDATGQPIEKAVWEFGMASLEKPAEIAWGHSWSTGGSHPGGKFEQLVHFTPDGRFDRLRVYAAGYETADVVLDLPNPRPLQVERTVRLKRGRTVTGVLRDHAGKPVANGWVFFIPKGHRSNIVEGVAGTDAHQLPKESRDAAVAEVRTNENGTFFLPVTVGGTLAASTELVDLWPFALPEDGHADLKMPAPSYLVIDLTYWYLDELVKKGKRALSPSSEDPNQCWIQVDQSGSTEPLWKNLNYRRQMLVFAHDPRAKLSKGVIVGHVAEGEMPQPIPGVGHNKNLSTKIRVALPPGSYRVQRLRAGPFAPVSEQQVVLKAGEDTIVSWARGDGSSVRGKATWPANMMFVRQPGEAPRKLDWTLPNTATVMIAPLGVDGKNGQPIEAAKIQADGSFFIATNLDPGKYKATARVTLPESDDARMRLGWRGPDCTYSTEFTVPDPARGPFGSPPVEVEIKMNVGAGGRFVATDPPAAPAKPANTVEPPAEKEKEPFTAWGQEVGGLQAGLGFKAGEKRVYTHGETVTLVVRVRKVIKNPLAATTLNITDKYIPAFYFDWPPTVTEGDGKAGAPIRVAGKGGDYNTKELTVEPGKEVELAEVKLELRRGSESGDKGLNTLYGTGKFQVHYKQLMYGSGKFAISSILSELATGKLELEVKEAPAEKQKVLTPEEAIKIAGDGKLAKEFNANKPPVEFKVLFVTKAILVKASVEKDAGWVHGHSPDDVCLGTLVPALPVKADDPLSKNQTQFVATLTAKAISQLNKAGINDMEKHFKGKTVRVTGTISWRAYDSIGDHSEVEIVIEDLSQIEVMK